MRIFKRYDDKIQVELKDVDKEGVTIKPFIAENSAHLNAWFNKLAVIASMLFHCFVLSAFL